MAGVVRHRAHRFTPGRRRALLTVAAVGALALPGAGGLTGLAMVHRRAHPPPVTTWITPVNYLADVQDLTVTTAPTRVRIPSLKVDSPLESLTVDTRGELASPTDYQRAGWFAGGTSPGDVGPAVIAGHVDSRTGPAVFFRLHELRPGAAIEVERDGRWVTFHVTQTQQYTKTQFPTDRVYGPTPAAELRLVTCGGAFDAAAHSYRDNVVVYAVLA